MERTMLLATIAIITTGLVIGMAVIRFIRRHF